MLCSGRGKVAITRKTVKRNQLILRKLKVWDHRWLEEEKSTVPITTSTRLR